MSSRLGIALPLVPADVVDLWWWSLTEGARVKDELLYDMAHGMRETLVERNEFTGCH